MYSIYLYPSSTVAPSISVPPVNVSVVSPDPTLLSCTADGLPSPSIVWLRLDNRTEVVLTTDSVLQIDTVLAYDNRTVTSNLTLNETQPFRSGVYVCVASNLLGSVRAMAQLTVNGESSFLWMPTVYYVPLVFQMYPISLLLRLTKISLLTKKI